MAHIPSNGKAAVISTQDFNERVKRVVADMPDPKKREYPRQSFRPRQTAGK